MKTIHKMLFAVLSLPLAGCLTVEDTGGYGGGYGGYGSGAYSGYGGAGYVERRSTYYHQPAYYERGYGSSYSRPYYSGYDERAYHGGHDSDNYRNYEREKDSDKKKKSSGTTVVRLTDYNEGRKRSVPDGYHSKEWFKDRGFDLKKNTYETRDGEYRGKIPSKHDKDSHKKESDKKDSNNKSSHKSND